jgi:hypothetical protein
MPVEHEAPPERQAGQHTEERKRAGHRQQKRDGDASERADDHGPWRRADQRHAESRHQRDTPAMPARVVPGSTNTSSAISSTPIDTSSSSSQPASRTIQ